METIELNVYMKKFFRTLSIGIVVILFFSGCNTVPDTETPYETFVESDTPSTTGSPDSVYSTPQESEPTVFIPVIGIYAGAGSWDENVVAFENFFVNSGYEYENFDEEDLIKDNFLDSFDLIWFPGGFSAEYRSLIPEAGHDAIRIFVENGGMLAATCAGAYYVADIMRWQGNDREYPLKIFKGTSVGPLSGLVGWGQITNIKLDETIFGSEFPDFLPMYYFDGPYFVPHDEEDIIVAARYVVNDEPAVIAGKYGEGKYILFGPHPELGGYTPSNPEINLDGEEGAQWPWLKNILNWFFSLI